MPITYFDTSALVRRYDLREPGSSRVVSLCAPSSGNVLLIARLTSVEMASALNRKMRERSITAVERDLLWRRFRSHEGTQYQVVALDEPTIRRAELLTFGYALRGYDALQLATALHASLAVTDRPSELLCCTADQSQAAAARREGLTVELIA